MNQTTGSQILNPVRFSIRAKLIAIITIIVLISLGSIIALVSWLVHEDLRIAAEENNFESNRYSATEAENLLANMISNSTMLMQTFSAAGAESSLAGQSRDFFFVNNPNIAALAFAASGEDGFLLNRRFFLSREIDTDLAGAFLQQNLTVLQRAAAGETLLLNASPHFGSPLLALFFPYQNQGALLLLSVINLSDSFGFGTNRSYMINDAGDILVHADFEMMLGARNLADDSFTRFIWDHPSRNAQRLHTDEEGIRYFGAFTKLPLGGTTVITSIEYDRVFEGIRATTRRNIYLTAAVLSISILFIWFFAKSISVPLKTLAEAARSIEGGDFDMNLASKSRDEIGVLTASFQRMCTALGIFGRFTNRDIAVRAMRGEIKPGGLPKHATIFFSDIRDFTALSEKFTGTFGDEASNRIVRWLNHYLGQMVNCVEETRGAVDKFIGDSVMAHWGTAYTDGSPEKDAYNCVFAALKMREALCKMNSERKPNDPADPPIRIGCGINTGIVTAGQIGSDLRMEYTVIGDPVNLASRVESLCKPLAADILISENTWILVKDKFITEEMPSVTVKGKEQPLRIFAVINLSGADEGPKTLADLRLLLGVSAPDISSVDVNSGEKKYKIGAD